MIRERGQGMEGDAVRPYQLNGCLWNQTTGFVKVRKERGMRGIS